jgi:hypothetical protein
MAFLRHYIQKCDKGCGADARQELLTWRNELYGRYCNKCAKRMLTMVLADEARYFEQTQATS